MTEHEQSQVPETNQAMVQVPPSGHSLTASSNGFAGAHPLGASFARAPEVVSGGMDRSWFIHSLRRRWLLALLMGLLMGSFAAAALFWVFPVSSSAVALYQVDSTEPFVIDPSRSSTHFDTFKATQLAALRSYFVLNTALAEPGVQDLRAVDAVDEKDQVQWLSDRLVASFPQNAEYLQIMISGSEPPEELRKLVEAVTKAYEFEVVQAERRKKGATQEVLQEAHRTISEKITGLTDRYIQLAKDLKAPVADTLDSQTKLMMNDVLELAKRKATAEAELLAVQTDFAVMQQMSKNPAIIEAQIEEAMKSDPKIAMLQQEINTRDYWIMTLGSATKRASSPQIKAYEREKASMQQQVAQYRQEMKQSMMNQQKSAPNPQMQVATTNFQTRATILTQQLKALEQELEKQKEELATRGEISVDLMVREAELDQLKDVQRDIQSRREALAVELSSKQERVTLAQPAQSREYINAYQRYGIASVGGIGGFALTCLAIAYMEFRGRRLNGPKQVDEGLGIRVIGTLPGLSSRRGLSQSSPVVAQLMESIDSVRTAIMHDSTAKRRQVVLVTSAATMEGRTTVASQLAASLARAGRRTLLIDGDVRRPALHALFDVPLEDGLCEVLRAEVDVADVIRPTHAEGLWLLTAGYCDADAVRALATEQIQPIFDKLRADYDFIIIDGAPVLGMPDSLLFGQYCDGAILSVLRDHTSVPKVYQASELLKSVGIRLIGAVVNGVSEKADNRIMHLQMAGPKSERKQLESAEV
ncbi:MAG: polysaccharide biosynthesis tyrosine autokinase [Pirellulales bacterium]